MLLKVRIMQKQTYSATAKFFHWSIAIMILFNLLSGTIIANLAEHSKLQLDLMDIHKQSGVIILTLVVCRIIWRLTHQYPSLQNFLPGNEILLARFGHLSLYLLMIAVPISGVIYSQSFGKYVSILWFKLPIIIPVHNQATVAQYLSYHKYLAISIATMICVHIIAALKHHLIDKNPVLYRMLPRFKTK